MTTAARGSSTAAKRCCHAAAAAVAALGVAAAAVIALVVLAVTAPNDSLLLVVSPPPPPAGGWPRLQGGRLLGLPAETVSEGGVHGWLVEAPAAPPGRRRAPLGVVLVHGARTGRQELASLAPFLRARAGASVLAIDLVTKGPLGGPAYGYGDHEDVLRAAAFLRGRLGRGARVVALGTSAGSAAVIRAAAASPTALDGIVTVGAYTSVRDVLYTLPPDTRNLLLDRFPWSAAALDALDAAVAASRSLVAWVAGERDPSATPLEEVRRVRQPHLLLHGSHDGLVHVDCAHALHAAAAEPKELHVVDHGSHSPLHIFGKCATLRAKVLGLLERARGGPAPAPSQ